MMKIEPFKFCGKQLGDGHTTYLVGEIGFNHNGDVELAKRMIESAVENGADAVKLQTFVAGEMISKSLIADDPDNPGNEIPFYEFFQRYELSRSDYEILFEYAKTLNIPLFSTPFDEASLEMLVELGTPAIKIASPDLTYLPFLEKVAETALPVVLSTGMGNEEEISRALEILQPRCSVILLHCVSNYPSKYQEMNLNCLQGMKSKFNVPIGLSDHTLDNLSAVVAASLGAVLIEKHFTTDRNLPGVDQSISIEPQELKKLKIELVHINQILGNDKKRIQPSEVPVKLSARRSLVARMDIAAGIALTSEMIACKRPGNGIPPTELDRVIGKPCKQDLKAEQVLTWGMF
ncbi:MAG: N,N'-diacetyllegionaminate synthase [Nitrospinales bacterium]|jgi:N,N'-diacetyllegionaminate synthase